MLHKIKTLLAGAAVAGALVTIAPTSALAAATIPSRAQCKTKDFIASQNYYDYVKSETRTSELGTIRITHFFKPVTGPKKWCAYNTSGREQFNTGTW
ncbi:hypothetical protein [Archangium lansingense]|uniref:Uncharacterized protein n=1 Tax=Archangium lansingense TaxID=2995310 RepID=A0ABT4AA42_9BACT|nr:hypothetical protein [Archangium lansinium]MCY1077812.1 hypothetical protein [Archangium lansinium]